LYNVRSGTGIAFSIVNRHDVAARWALELGFLLLEECFYSVLFDFTQVANYADPVTRLVTPVHPVNSFAGQVLTLIAEPNLFSRQFQATAFDEAVLAPRNAA
jgi:hypothetical protein